MPRHNVEPIFLLSMVKLEVDIYPRRATEYSSDLVNLRRVGDHGYSSLLLPEARVGSHGYSSLSVCLFVCDT